MTTRLMILVVDFEAVVVVNVDDMLEAMRWSMWMLPDENIVVVLVVIDDITMVAVVVQ